MSPLIDWFSDSFGTAGHNVHASSVGSWVGSESGEEQ